MHGESIARKPWLERLGNRQCLCMTIDVMAVPVKQWAVGSFRGANNNAGIWI